MANLKFPSKGQHLVVRDVGDQEEVVLLVERAPQSEEGVEVAVEPAVEMPRPERRQEQTLVMAREVSSKLSRPAKLR